MAAHLPCAAQATFLPLCASSFNYADPEDGDYISADTAPLCAASAAVTGICATAALCAQASAGPVPLPG